MVLEENKNEHLADSSTLFVACFNVTVPFLVSLEGEGVVKVLPYVLQVLSGVFTQESCL